MNTWTWTWAIRKLVSELLMPPGIWVFIGIAAIFLMKRHKTFQKRVIFSCLLMIWITGTTAFANLLIQITDPIVNWPKPLIINNIDQIKQLNPPQAIVILGGGKRRGAVELPEYGFNDVSKETMERLRVGAKLAKKTGLPVLLTGGAPDAASQDTKSEAEVMALVMQQELGVKPKWLENQSNSTVENAKLSSKLLKEQHIQGIYLVTHFWHMPRAQKAFQMEKINVITVPHGYQDLNQFEINKLMPVDFLASSSGIIRTRQIWHELLGSIWVILAK